MRPRVILDVAPRGLLWRPNRRTCFGVGGHSFLQLYRWLCHNFRLFYFCRAAGLTHSSVPSLIISARTRSKAPDESCERFSSS